MPARTRDGVRSAGVEKVFPGTAQEPPVQVTDESSPVTHVRVPAVAEPAPVMVAVTSVPVVTLVELMVQVGSKTCRRGKAGYVKCGWTKRSIHPWCMPIRSGGYRI